MKRGARWLLIAGLGVVLVTGLIQGQARSTSPPQEQPALRVTTRLVEVNVIVQDRAGQPVSDLTRDDFVVLDKGREQPIAFFSKESAATPRAPWLPPTPPAGDQ